MITRALEDSEIKAIFDNIDGYNAVRNRAMLICGIGIALRATELVGLTVGDVYDGEKVKTYTTIRAETAKFNKEREIRTWGIVGGKLQEFIEWKKAKGQSVEPDAPLFVSREGGHLTRQALFEIVKKILRSSGVNQSCHALRKTGATIFYLASGGDLVSTQLFLGHASPETTRKYIGIPSQRMKEHSITSSQWLSNAIERGEFDTKCDNMSNSDLTIQDAIQFLNEHGFDVTLSQKEGLKAQKQKNEAKVIKFPVSA